MKWGRASSLLINPDLKLILFGGKGGSGKTTSAAATALYLNKFYPKKKILVMSTDPAHSLGDSFNIVIGGNITPITETLWGLEMNPKESYDLYLKENGDVIKEIATRGALFDKEDIESFFAQTLPGLDELMAIIKIADLLKTQRYDLIILDTAPTGHTLVLLSLPEQLMKFTHIMDLMMQRYRTIVTTLTGRYKKDRCDEFITKQREDVKRVKGLLSNYKTTEFVAVTIPEPMSIAEIERALKTFKKYPIQVKNIIVNRVAKEKRDCPYCLARQEENERGMKEIGEKFASYNLIQIPLFPHEIRGIKLLNEYASLLFDELEWSPVRAKAAFPLESFPLPKGNLSRLLKRDGLDFIIFGGKGGVGKTSITCANAIHLAKQRPEKKVLVFSTDPAHSLSDCFEQKIGDKITPISGFNNLFALETAGMKWLEQFRQDYHDDVEDAFEQMLGSEIDASFDREIMGNLIDIIPPGVEELMALMKIIDLRKEGKYDFYLMDSAASGHLIRFLELPHTVRDWLRTIFRVLLKHKWVARLPKLIERLLRLSQDIKNILDTLSNPQKTEFVMITIPEEMGVAEMQDLSSSIAHLKIPSSHAIINMISPPTRCEFCLEKRRDQQKYIDEIAKKLRGQTIIPIPLLPHNVSGPDSLKELAEIMY